MAQRPTDPLLLDACARRLVEAGRLDEAVPLLQRCVAANPDFAPCWNHLGVVRITAGDAAGARSSWQRALELDPGLLPARLNLAELALKSGQYEAAMREFDAACRAAPEDVRAWKGLAAAALEMEFLPRAREAFESATRLAPGDGSAWTGLGKVYLLADQYADARRALARARDANPENPESRVLAALALVDDPAESAGLEEAGRELRSALAGRQFSAEAAYGLGSLALRQGRPADAASYFRRAAAENPADERVLYRLGRALIAAGRRAEGQRALRRYHTLFRLKREITALRLRLELDPGNRALRKRLADGIRRVEGVTRHAS